MNETQESQPKSEEKVFEPIQREIGERVILRNGRDYTTPEVRIVPSTFQDAQEHEKAIHIKQGKNMGISISLASLEAIAEWAKGLK